MYNRGFSATFIAFNVLCIILAIALVVTALKYQRQFAGGDVKLYPEYDTFMRYTVNRNPNSPSDFLWKFNFSGGCNPQNDKPETSLKNNQCHFYELTRRHWVAMLALAAGVIELLVSVVAIGLVFFAAKVALLFCAIGHVLVAIFCLVVLMYHSNYIWGDYSFAYGKRPIFEKCVCLKAATAFDCKTSKDRICNYWCCASEEYVVVMQMSYILALNAVALFGMSLMGCTWFGAYSIVPTVYSSEGSKRTDIETNINTNKSKKSWTKAHTHENIYETTIVPVNAKIDTGLNRKKLDETRIKQRKKQVKRTKIHGTSSKGYTSTKG